jgi:RNA ligase (TIGR02306 family)
MTRKLASIQRIESIAPIPNADAIEQARVMGWTVVTKCGEFTPGDLCVFFEVDSVLPDGASWAEFMRPRQFRVKTVKLRGVLSQGLALPLDILSAAHGLSVDDDVTDALGVVKFELPAAPMLRGEQAGHFPTAIPKTDETRLQSVLGVREELRGLPFVWSVKLDGTSATFAKMDGELVVCSRNWAMNDGPTVYWDMARRYSLAERLPDGMAVQGEICGPGIQKNRLGLTEPDLFIFNVYDIRSGAYLDHDTARALADSLGLKSVPEGGRGGVCSEEVPTLDDFLELARGTYAGTKNRREGIVVRPLVETHSRRLQGRLSFKVINNDFLLKDEE